MKRRLVLHLGLPRTGTTSIQRFLRGNPDLLAAHGVWYPDVTGGESVHPVLAPSVLRRNPGRGANHLALAMEIRKAGRASNAGPIPPILWSAVFERAHAGNAHTLIISYENFHHRPELYGFDAIAAALKDFELEGIIYLRSQENWLTSLYAQLIRGAGRLATPMADLAVQRRGELSYSMMLDHVLAHIPLDHLMVANFDNASATGLLADFVEKIGMPRHIGCSSREKVVFNRSLPCWATLFLLRCNQARIPDEAFREIRKTFVRGMTPDDFPRLRPGLDVATPEEREGLRAAAAADADRLQERYGITLPQHSHERIAYRPFDREDVDAIRNALAAKVTRSAMEALDRI